MKFNYYIKELQRRNVFKSALAYLVVAWLITQVLSIIIPAFELPPSLLKKAIVVLIIGFPIWLIFSWVYEITPEGLRKTQDVELEKSMVIKTNNRLNKIIIGTLGITIVLLVINLFFISQNTTEPNDVDNDRIAILSFGNNTGNEDMDLIGKMTEDWITHGINENNLGAVIGTEAIMQVAEVSKAGVIDSSIENVLKEYFKPSKKIEGNYFLNNDKIIFQCSVYNGLTDETLIAFEAVDCDAKNPLDCIEELKERILSYLAIDSSDDLILPDKIPKYEAYKALLEADANSKMGNDEEYKALLDKAIVIDSTFLEPQIFKLDYYYNRGEYKVVDSLLKNIKRRAGMTKRQSNLLNMWEALLDGNNNLVYKYGSIEYNFNGFDLNTNSSQMVITHQFANRPEEVEAVFNSIKMDNFDLTKCSTCADRYFLMAEAYITLNKYRDAIALLEPVVNIFDGNYLRRILLKAYILNDNKEKVDQLINEVDLKFGKMVLNWFYLIAAEKYLLSGKVNEANRYLNIIVNADKKNVYDWVLRDAYYLLGDYSEAEKLAFETYKKRPNDPFDIEILSKIYYKNGKITQSDALIEALEKLRKQYQYGMIDYKLAEIYAARNDEDKVFEHLLKSVSSGNRYDGVKFINDTDFIPFLDSEKWDEIMTYWH
ncbi:MAG: hypothetical protein HKN00_14345 [Flavobacteriaceae bacterium]|nr:hypothetical protein [Bacteroidia bacterium]NNF76362.1 hypothetical protein [Flavobacteriaceae bacterium]NNK72971.1 hypothetical protein [Flavobacteriaceae bacterium]